MGRYDFINASHTAQVKLIARSMLGASTPLPSSLPIFDPEMDSVSGRLCKSSKKMPPIPRCSPLDGR